ncbi:MAG: LacI family DNA-binding transcriptional regulator [Pirellulales bacterium]|nr:LacI family DNA-binding transcriptional regulator [Pirellulales bacterium]
MSSSQVPRLKDVARAANVSLAAASRILRGDRKRFGEETCRRVLEASQKLGWRRNLLVSGMQTGRTQTVGVLIPPFDSYWISVLSGIHEALTESEYLPITVWVGSLGDMPHFETEEARGLELINRLLDRRVDGLIMWPPFGLNYYHHFPEFVKRRVPVAVIDHYSSVADSVETDEKQATALVAEHLLSLGHRRIACLSSREAPSQTWAIKRRASFEEALRNSGTVQFQSWHLNQQGTDGPEVARSLLTSGLKPTAVFTVSDHEAAFVYSAAKELGLSIPGDLSVVGFADLDFAATLVPPLTTIRQRPEEIGRLSAKLIIDRIEGRIADEAAPTTVCVPADLVERASTARAPSS